MGRLPAYIPADLPEPLPLRKVIGPGVVGAAVGLASGEFVLWPYISANIGLGFLWGAVVGVILQFFINMEIERYTLATGETALTGFSRLWRHWALVFIVLAMLANMWPGWATSSATVLTYAIGGGNVVAVAIGELVLIGIILTLAPVVYQWVERIEFAKVAAVGVLLIGALIVALTSPNKGGLAQAFTSPTIPLDMGAALILGALAFAGAGGAQNLVQSNWIRDKGLGMGARMPKLVSPVTGEPATKPSTGYLFEPDEANMRRWHGWWKVANTEQLVSFVLITVVTITVMSMLAYSTVFGQGVENDVTFLQVEGDTLNSRTGWFGTFFWVIGAYSLFAAALGILDYMGRLVSDALKVTYLGANQWWSEARIYVAVVWTLITIGVGVLLAGFDQPLALLVTSAVVGGFMMFLYSGLLMILNRRALPRQIELRGHRLVIMGIVFLFFGFFSLLTILDRLGLLS